MNSTWRKLASTLPLLILLAAHAALLSGCAAGPRPLQLVSGADPVYPPEAKAAGVQGHVTVRYDVTGDGAVVNLRIVEAVPSGVFDTAALDAVAKWRFRPPVQADQGHTSTLRFQLGESDAYDQY